MTAAPVRDWDKIPEANHVHPDVRCALCDRRPRDGEKFGAELHDWDALSMECPECWTNHIHLSVG